MTRTQVVIVGAGLAGLHAARLLRAANIECLLLEARSRLGGRIMSVDADARPADDGFDLGPSWYWPHLQPEIGALVAELGLPAFPQSTRGDVIFERMSREGPQRFPGTEQEPLSFRLSGGTFALVRALARDLPHDSVWLGAAVTAMALRSNGVELEVQHIADGKDGMQTLMADHVIAALPPRLLASTVTFTPAQEASTLLRWRDTPTWMAPHAKFVALYDRPFWREAGLSGTAQSMVGPMPEMHDATTASGLAALFGFVGVSADRRAALGETALTRACLEQIARLFGPNVPLPRATLLKDWAADPLTATAADGVATGHPVPGVVPWVAGPWRARLALAGSETSPREPGYLEGAVVAGARAAEETLENIRSGGGRG